MCSVGLPAAHCMPCSPCSRPTRAGWWWFRMEGLPPGRPIENSRSGLPNGTVIARGDEPPRHMDSAPAGARTEQHLRNIRQLTHGRQNAEAYFSFNGQALIFQSTLGGRGCYQQYVMGLVGSDVRMVSAGRGTTTCGYFLSGDRRVLFSSTHAKSPECPPKPSA